MAYIECMKQLITEILISANATNQEIWHRKQNKESTASLTINLSFNAIRDLKGLKLNIFLSFSE